MRLIAIPVALAATLCSISAKTEEQPIHLKDGAGADVVAANCSVCHSLDYVLMNSPFLKPEQWDAEVGKMMKAFGCPVDAPDAKAIKDYLKANYGG